MFFAIALGQGVRMGDTQATATALSTAVFFLFLSSSRPLPRLSPRRPPSSVLSPYMFASIITQVRAHNSRVRRE